MAYELCQVRQEAKPQIQVIRSDRRSLSTMGYPPQRYQAPPAMGRLAFNLTGVAAAVIAGGVLSWLSTAPYRVPVTITKDWQESSKEYRKENQMDPFTTRK